MSPPAACVAATDRLARATEVMTRAEVRELPVIDDGAKLVGILTQADLLPYRGHFEWTLVQTAMTPAPVTVSPGVAVDEAARILLDQHVNALPVVEGRALVGMLRRNDLLRLLARP